MNIGKFSIDNNIELYKKAKQLSLWYGKKETLDFLINGLDLYKLYNDKRKLYIPFSKSIPKLFKYKYYNRISFKIRDEEVVKITKEELIELLYKNYLDPINDEEKNLNLLNRFASNYFVKYEIGEIKEPIVSKNLIPKFPCLYTRRELTFLHSPIAFYLISNIDSIDLYTFKIKAPYGYKKGIYFIFGTDIYIIPIDELVKQDINDIRLNLDIKDLDFPVVLGCLYGELYNKIILDIKETRLIEQRKNSLLKDSIKNDNVKVVYDMVQIGAKLPISYVEKYREYRKEELKPFNKIINICDDLKNLTLDYISEKL